MNTQETLKNFTQVTASFALYELARYLPQV